MQVLDRSRLMAIPPIWRLGFRPFFLGGALFAVLAIALWLAALAGLWSGWQPVGGWLAWHRHEMLFGFGVAIIAGFLLTAVQTWTGVPGLQGKPLALLAGLWLAARLAWLFDAPLALLLVLQLSFLPLLAWAIGRSLWRVRQKRNYPVVGLLLLLTLADALVLLGLFEGNDDWQRRASIAALWLIAGMMNLIGGRVIPFFTQRGLGRQQQVPAIAWLDNGILLGCVLVALLTAAGVTTQPTPWLAGLFAALGGAQLWRLWRWRDRGIWQVPLLWSLHLAYFWIAVAPLGMALWSLGLALAPSQALHALAVGGMGGLILAMLARVTLGHTGRALQPPAAMPWAFALLNLGCAARVFPAQPVAGELGAAPGRRTVGFGVPAVRLVLCADAVSSAGRRPSRLIRGLAADAAAPGSASRRSCASAWRSAPGRACR